MKDSKILRKAAEYVDRHRAYGGCYAVMQAAAPYLSSDARLGFRNYLRPAGLDSLSYWWGVPQVCSEQDHNARVIGLLLAAHIAEDAGQ